MMAAVVAACASTALRLPEPLRALPDPAETRIAILDGMQRRRWSVMDERPEAILAGIEVRGHVAKMWVEYDTEFVRFRYGGSTALDCRPSADGCSSIHGKYMQWTRNLAAAIADELATRRRAAGGVTMDEPLPGR
jgi:hypothetical protein